MLPIQAMCPAIIAAQLTGTADAGVGAAREIVAIAMRTPLIMAQLPLQPDSAVQFSHTRLIVSNETRGPTFAIVRLSPIAAVSRSCHGPLMIIDCPSAYVIDGDTLRCGPDRIRLLGIDAPEMGSCPRWRVCVRGDGRASKRSLIAALKLGRVRYQAVTVDRFGRQVAVVWAGRINLSCWQLQKGQAIYKPKWDNGQLVARDCR